MNNVECKEFGRLLGEALNDPDWTGPKLLAIRDKHFEEHKDCPSNYCKNKRS